MSLAGTLPVDSHLQVGTMQLLASMKTFPTVQHINKYQYSSSFASAQLFRSPCLPLVRKLPLVLCRSAHALLSTCCAVPCAYDPGAQC